MLNPVGTAVVDPVDLILGFTRTDMSGLVDGPMCVCRCGGRLRVASVGLFSSSTEMTACKELHGDTC